MPSIAAKYTILYVDWCIFPSPDADSQNAVFVWRQMHHSDALVLPFGERFFTVLSCCDFGFPSVRHLLGLFREAV
jgi:hypothetical protein